MSLRADMHAAIDEIAPSSPMLANRAEAYVLADDRGQRRLHRANWTTPLGGMVVLLAAALVVVLFAGLVFGGRVWRDWNSSVYRPTPINHALLKRLEARPLNLPTVGPGADCPFGPLVQTPHRSGLGPLAYGDGLGPLYSEGSGQRYVTSWGTYILTEYVVAPDYSGLILIRARDLQTNQVVAFAHYPLFKDFYPAIPIGAMDGTDRLFDSTVQRYTELAIQPQDMYTDPAGRWPTALQLQGFPTGSSGCIGFQVDGADFTEQFVVSY